MGALVQWLFVVITLVSETVAGGIGGSGLGGTALLLLFQVIEGAVIGLLVLKAGGLIYKDIDTLSPNLFSVVVAVVLMALGAVAVMILRSF